MLGVTRTQVSDAVAGTCQSLAGCPKRVLLCAGVHATTKSSAGCFSNAMLTHLKPLCLWAGVRCHQVGAKRLIQQGKAGTSQFSWLCAGVRCHQGGGKKLFQQGNAGTTRSPFGHVQVSDAIREGAEGYFSTQYGTISKLSLVLAALIWLLYRFRQGTPEQEAAGLTR